MKHVFTVIQITFGFWLATWLTVAFAPTSWWYEYRLIEPKKPVYEVGEPLSMVSDIIVYVPGTEIEFRDQLRCLTGDGDKVVAVGVFPTALKGPENKWRKVPWVWGKVPEGAPKDVPCYIRSVQKLTVLFGIERITEYQSKTFEIVDFDYTKQQQSR